MRKSITKQPRACKGIALFAAVLMITSALTGCNNPASGGDTSYVGWTRLLGVSSASTSSIAISVDSDGVSYAAGYTEGNLGGESLTGTRDAFICLYDESGNKEWTTLLGVSNAATQANGITTDSSGNSYITGYTTGKLGGETCTGTKDMFLCKINSTGSLQWTKLLGSTGVDTVGNDINLDTDGNIVITGYTYGDISDSDDLTGSIDMFTAKYDSSGDLKWCRLLGTSSATYNWTWGRGIDTDYDENVYVAGYSKGSVDSCAITGNSDLFITKYDSDGVTQWTRMLGISGGSVNAFSLTSDSNGNSYVTGYTGGGDLDGETGSGGYDMFLVKYDSSGSKQWTRLLGVNSYTTCGKDVSLDSSGNPCVTGFTFADLDGESHKAGSGYLDAFVTKYSSGGTKQWTRLLGVSGANTQGNSIGIGSDDICRITGFTAGDLEGQTCVGSSALFLSTNINGN